MHETIQQRSSIRIYAKEKLEAELQKQVESIILAANSSNACCPFKSRLHFEAAAAKMGMTETWISQPEKGEEARPPQGSGWEYIISWRGK